MQNKIRSLAMIFTIISLLLVTQPVYAAPDAPIDLTTDNNGNQVADSIEQEFDTLVKLSPKEQAAEIARFVSLLPISDETRELQKQSAELAAQLASLSSDNQLQVVPEEEITKVLEEMAVVNQQIDQDPAIILATASLEKLYIDRGYLPTTLRTTDAPNFGLLKKGDVLARRSGLFVLWPWAMTYEHTGNLDTVSQVYESNSDGVRLKPISQWKTPGSYVGVKRHNKVSATTIARSIDWAKSKYKTDGTTKYNYNFLDKGTDARLYCSQLSWKIGKNAGVDLDSNSSVYLLWASVKYGAWIIATIIPAVAPDEVMLDSDLSLVTSGWN